MVENASPQTRDEVLRLHQLGLSPIDIATEINRSFPGRHRDRHWASRMLYKLREAGRIEREDGLNHQIFAQVELAGGAGRSVAALQRLLVCDPDALARTIRRLVSDGQLRREDDGLLFSAAAARIVETQGERKAGMAPLIDVVAYAQALAQGGSPERAVAFLRRAHERLLLGPGPLPAEAINLLILADLINAPESRDASGRLRGYGPLPDAVQP